MTNCEVRQYKHLKVNSLNKKTLPMFVRSPSNMHSFR